MFSNDNSADMANNNASEASLPVLAGRNYHCQCGQPVFFRNSKCLICGTPLGYDPERGMLLSLMRGPQPDTWQEWQAHSAPATAPADDSSPPSLEDIPGQEAPRAEGYVSDAASMEQGQQQQQQQQQFQQQQQEQVLFPPGVQGMAPAVQMPPPPVSQAGIQPQDQNADQNPQLAPAPLAADGSAPLADAALPPAVDAAPPPPELGPDLGAPLYKRCLNLSTPASCNWLISAHDPQHMCRACRLNRTIPDLTDPALPDNGYLWGLVELAKRRLVSALITMNLPVASRITEDPERGMMFDFLRSPLNGPHVMTGHNTGLITLNVDEADDAKREAVRKAMREPYRTLVGHFRHEVGHYYWDRLIRGTPWMDGFHRLFGDETANYAESLKKNYDEGPPSDWPLHFVSAYASTHPWEDWAECWAHYLHMRDAIDTALSFGLSVDRFDLEFTPFTLDALYDPEHPEAAHFLGFLNHWTRLTTMLNEMSRSMGQPDFYPFVLPRDVVAKLHFIHLVVRSGSWMEDRQPQVAAPMQPMAPMQSMAPMASFEPMQPMPPMPAPADAVMNPSQDQNQGQNPGQGQGAGLNQNQGDLLPQT